MGKMTRRDFLKIGFTGAALTGMGGALTSCFSPAPEVPRKMARTAGKPVTVASTCRLCPAGCGILGEVADGRVTKIMGQPPAPEQPGEIMFPRPRRAGMSSMTRTGCFSPLKRSGQEGGAVDKNHLGAGPGGNLQRIGAAPPAGENRHSVGGTRNRGRARSTLPPVSQGVRRPRRFQRQQFPE